MAGGSDKGGRIFGVKGERIGGGKGRVPSGPRQDGNIRARRGKGKRELSTGLLQGGPFEEPGTDGILKWGVWGAVGRGRQKPVLSY